VEELWYSRVEILLAVALTLFGRDCVVWLPTGEWQPVRAGAFVTQPFDSAWLASAKSWLGVHSIVTWLARWSASWVVPLFAFAFFVALLAWARSREVKRLEALERRLGDVRCQAL
jgi:hypothetical protein